MSDMIDFKKLRANANTILQGDYPVVADKVTYKKTQTDKHMWTVNLKVTAGPYAGRVITHNMVLSPELDFAVKRFFREMDALGADEKFFDSNPSVDAISAQIQGRHALATFAESKNEFRGEKREEVVNLVAAKGGVVTVAGASGLPTASALPAATPVAVATPVDAGEAPTDPF
jgi:hypothetical protein